MKALSIMLVFGLFSCSSETAVPRDILPPPRMSKVLWDVIRSDETANQQYRLDTSNSLFRQSTKLYQAVFQLHQVTDSQFKQSFRYYQAHPVKMRMLLDSLESFSRLSVSDTLKKPLPQ